MRSVSPEARRALSLEYATTNQHKHKVAQTVARIREALTASRMPYVAFSGGKDSLVLAWLVERITGGVTLAWSDDELEYPETVEMMTTLHDTGSLAFAVTSGVSRHANWFAPWTDRPFWRDPLPGTIWIDGDQDDWMASQGYDLTFVGTRAEESRKRRDWLVYANATWGATYPTRSGTGTRCCPMWDWSSDDVWAYTVTHDVPVNPVYHRLAEIGVLPHKQRLGPLPLVPRAVLADRWPDLLTRLETRYGPRWT